MTPDGSGPSDAPGGEADGNRLVSPQEGAGNLPTWRKPKRLPGHAGVGGDEQARADGDQASACRPEIDPRDPTRNGVQESMPARTTVDGSHELTVGNRESHLVTNEVEIACRRGHPQPIDPGAATVARGHEPVARCNGQVGTRDLDRRDSVTQRPRRL